MIKHRYNPADAIPLRNILALEDLEKEALEEARRYLNASFWNLEFNSQNDKIEIQVFEFQTGKYEVISFFNKQKKSSLYLETLEQVQLHIHYVIQAFSKSPSSLFELSNC